MSARVDIDREFYRWIDTFGALVPEMIQAATRPAFAVAEEMYDATQAVVHVVTGALRESGSGVLISVDFDEIEVWFTYGGASSPHYVDYAQYEFGRGGFHDAITIADDLVNPTDKMERAIDDAWEHTWR